MTTSDELWKTTVTNQLHTLQEGQQANTAATGRVLTAIQELGVQVDRKIDAHAKNCKGRASWVPEAMSRMPKWAKILVPIAAALIGGYFGVDLSGIGL